MPVILLSCYFVALILQKTLPNLRQESTKPSHTERRPTILFYGTGL